MEKTLALGLATTLLASCEQQASETKPEVVETTVKLDLPAVPAFTEPPSYGDGTHSVLEMRRHGKKFLDQDVRIKGYVVWIYDCIQVLGEKVAKEAPEKCDRPNFYLGDEPETPHDKAIWVVDVPRPLRPDENERTLGKEITEQLQREYEAMPKFSRGQKVVVSGKWAVQSPKGFKNSEGLVVYGGLENLDTGLSGTMPTPAADPGATPAPSAATAMPAGATKAPPPH